MIALGTRWHAIHPIVYMFDLALLQIGFIACHRVSVGRICTRRNAPFAPRDTAIAEKLSKSAHLIERKRNTARLQNRALDLSARIPAGRPAEGPRL